MSTDKSGLFYEHSGRMGAVIPMLLLLGLPAIVLLSAAYSWIVVYCPVVGYVNIVFLFGYVFLGGTALGILAKAAKCRSPGMLMLIAFMISLVGYYFVWVFFLQALATYTGEDAPNVLMIALQPVGVWQAACAINADGWWGPSGIIQWILCVVEAIVMIGGITLLASSGIEREVFCEDCGTWCNAHDTMHLKPSEEMMAEGGEIDHLKLLALEETTEVDYPRFEAEILQCTGCQMTQGIRFQTVTQVMDDGNLKENKEDIAGILMQKKSNLSSPT